MKYSIHLNVYDGPLDLLCDMISKQKIDIKDISIIEITKQYLSYINMLEAMDLEVTSDFITMATKLLEIKSKYLLFSQRELDEEEDPRLELMEQLKEYKKYKKASEVLKDSVDYLNQPYYRNREEIIIDDKVDLNEISIESIKSILPYIFKVKNIEEENETKKDERLNKIVRGKIISVEEKIEYIQNILTTADKISFNNIIKDNTKDEVIATFLSLLELIKSKEIVVVQENFFEDIIIKKNLEN
jgi:segregation and condensation protein A